MKYILAALCCALAMSAHGQSIVRIARAGLLRTPRPVIRRTITVPIAHFDYARQAVQYQRYTHKELHEHMGTHLQLTTERAIARHELRSPSQIIGPYNYVRAHSTVAKMEGTIHPSFVEDWKHLNDVQGYRGAHHLVNKYALEMIYKEQKRLGIKQGKLHEMQSNAPTIYHPLHGDPTAQEVFHDADKQVHDYFNFGMKVVVLGKLADIDLLNTQHGFPNLPQTYIEAVLAEAQLWSIHNGLVWERDFNPF